MKNLYTASLHTSQGRDGSARCGDGKLYVRLAFPTALGGRGEGTNREQVFAAAFSACFASAIHFAAGQQRLDSGEVAIAAAVALFVRDDGRHSLRARFDVAVLVSPAPTDSVIGEAKRICAYLLRCLGGIRRLELMKS